MAKRFRILLVLAAAAAFAVQAFAQTPGQSRSAAPFDEFFVDKALRVDLYQTGDAKGEVVTLDQIYLEGAWPEPPSRLLDPFDYGRYVVRLYDVASNRLIFSRGFDTTFAEYKTTTPAIEGVKRVFERSLRVPCPKRPVLFVVEARDKFHLLQPLFTRTIDPSDYHIIREAPAAGDWIYEAVRNGDPRDHVDFVFLSEGYTAADKEKFKADVDRFAAFLFTVEPYKSMKDRFNISGVFRPSPEKAMDEPRQRVYRKTVLNASFNAFDLDRYMLIEEDHRMHEMAGQVPYDAIIVLVNSTRYGGGSIAFDYCVTTVDHPRSLEVFVHELGHSFAGLADEYYASEVSYNDFYPKGVEPLEPNITALLDPANIKWKDLLSPGIAIPTEYGKEEREALASEMKKNREARDRDVAEAKAGGADEAKIRKITDKYAATNKALRAKSDESEKRWASALGDKVGAFEGAGYTSKGLYRSMMYCIMISSPKNEFCRVCQQAIARMISSYSGAAQGN